MKKVKFAIAIVVMMIILAGCNLSNQEKIIVEQNSAKIDQATKMMEHTKTPQFNESLERENIRNRLIISNDPNTLQWIYPMSAGRVIGRFPVKGKVTSGGKRLSTTQALMPFSYGDGSVQYNLTEAPDEMGTYGSSGDYIFWFDPAGRIHQFKGDYFVSTVPYKIDSGLGTITMETDAAEEKKVDSYKNQIKESNSTTNQGGKK